MYLGGGGGGGLQGYSGLTLGRFRHVTFSDCTGIKKWLPDSHNKVGYNESSLSFPK